jgi:hypothetical protein
MNKLGMAIFAAAVSFAMQNHTEAQNSLFDITFSNSAVGGSTLGSGWISGYAINPGVYEITNGSLSVTSGEGLDAGVYSLLPNTTPPGQSSSPSGYFLFDNQVSPNVDPLMDNGGLLFGSGSIEMNLFSNAGNTPEYQLYENNGASVLGDVTLMTVPEPSSLMLLPFGAGLWLLRVNRKTWSLSGSWFCDDA